MFEDNTVYKKAKTFAKKTVELYKHLTRYAMYKEFVMSKQMMRSGTSIGANIKEGLYAQSVPDFISKFSIALKEAGETEYWLELLAETDYITNDKANEMLSDCQELIRLLAAIIKKKKDNLNNPFTPAAPC